MTSTYDSSPNDIDEAYGEILDPTGIAAGAGPTGTPAPAVASRPRSLDGLTVGLLENTKHHAAYLLDQLGDALLARYGVQDLVRATKHDFGQPMPEEMLTSFVSSCDVMIIGIGDCGACSASAVADGIEFEREGIPAAVICSDAYRVTASAMAGVQGMADYEYLTTRHPVAILERSEVNVRAAQLLPQVLSMLTDQGRTP
ncbi:conserved hypothetical protein [Citricoccus sp. K5]|nr:conserved hypothetical protein [Citricoccus sp. K5]